MALGLSRYYKEVLGQDNLGRNGPGSRVSQASYLPSDRPWLSTLAGGRSSQVNTVKNNLANYDSEGKVIDPFCQDPVYNDVYVSAIPEGFPKNFGWLHQSPENIVSQANSGFNYLEDDLSQIGTWKNKSGKDLEQVDPALYAAIVAAGEANGSAPAEQLLLEYQSIYNGIGDHSIAKTNKILNQMLIEGGPNPTGDFIPLLAHFCKQAQDAANGRTERNENSIWAVGGEIMTGMGEKPTNFGRVFDEFTWLNNNGYQAELAQAAYPLSNNPQGEQEWSAPGLSGIPPSLWLAEQDPNVAAQQVTFTPAPGAGPITESTARIAQMEAVYEAVSQVHLLYLRVVDVPVVMPWAAANLTPATPIDPYPVPPYDNLTPSKKVTDWDKYGEIALLASAGLAGLFIVRNAL